MDPLTFEMDPSAMRSKDPPISSVSKLNRSFDRSKQSKDPQSLAKGSNRENHRRGEQLESGAVQAKDHSTEGSSSQARNWILDHRH